MTGPVGGRLGDGRLHFQHGPIDLIITLDGPADGVDVAARRGWERFQTILGELASELPALRQAMTPHGEVLRQRRSLEPCETGEIVPPGALRGIAARCTSGRGESIVKSDVARAMAQACQPFADHFITPMAAVAGAVADEILASIRAVPPLRRALINNGGDIAFYLGDGETVTIGLAARPEDLAIAGTITLNAADATRGVATSGWRGRSQSLGIADAVTVLAATGATADAAATMIANEVNIDHPAIARLAAREVKDDSDLGDLPVTVAVGPLPGQAIAQALTGGEDEAMRLLQAGLIQGAVLLLQGQIRVIGTAEHRSLRVLQSCL
jgi:ApbE superfamily uncharacterized protein (UPF0280 family)